MDDEFARLMRQPRLCRVCGKPCQGLRCGECHSLQGRITRHLRGAGPEGMEESRLIGCIQLETVLRGEERAGRFHETPTGWALGMHPERRALWEAWAQRQAALGLESFAGRVLADDAAAARGA